MKKLFFKSIFLVACFFVAATGNSQEYHHYFGNIHSHTKYSDGTKDSDESGVATPAQAYAYAKKSKHFDFLGISEHNHKAASMAYENYAKGISQAAQANDDGDFVCMYGMEYGVIKGGGHVLVYGFDKLIGWDDNAFDILVKKNDYKALWKTVANKKGAFATLAHPHTEDFSKLITLAYSKEADDAICGVAVANGPHDTKEDNYKETPKMQYYRYYQKLLAKGYHVGPTIDHDNHNTTFGRTSAGRTVILASELSRDEIMKAYRAMRFYASEDWNTEVEYTFNNKPMGSEIKAAHGKLHVRITDKDATDRIEKVKVMYGTPGTDDLPTVFIEETSNDFTYDINLDPGESLYIYLEITQNDGDKIVTAPIWIERDAEEF